jgi:sucrose-6-phosphate hydrolase SacC (GH32 family)
MISAVRVLSWSTAWQRLLSNPADEYASLRNGTLLASTTPTVVAHAMMLPIPAGSGAAMDLGFDVAIPTNASDVVALKVQVLAPTLALVVAKDADARQQNANGSAAFSAHPPPVAAPAQITVELSAAFPNGTRVGRVGGKSATSFPILASETSVMVRVLVDRSVAEFFVGGGRAVETLRSYPKAGDDRVVITSSSGVVLKNIHAYDMGCGWV